MMRKNLIVFGLFIFFSCNNKLDIAPENTLVDRDVFKTEAGSEQALSEAYYNFLKAVTNSFTYNFADYSTPVLQKTSFYDTYTHGEVTPTDYNVVNTWTLFFAAINSSNNVIAKIPLYAAYPDKKQQQFIGEAKFIRAFCYFNLLCLFGDGALSGNESGLGLPIQLTPFEGYNTGEIIARSSNKEVFDQVIKDLKEALPALPDRFPDEVKTRSRATLGAASALLSRVYLFRGDFKNAATSAQAVLDKKPALYQLTSNLLALFPSNPSGSLITPTSEYIFGFPVSQMVSNNTSTSNNIGSAYYFKRSYWINPAFIDEFEPGDLRVGQLMWKGDTIYNTSMLQEKTTFKFNNSTGRDNVPMIRLAEVMLTKAEAIARTEGVTEEAVQLLNEVRNRSVPSALPFSVDDFHSREQLTDKILQQRKFELAFEGILRYDMIRNKIPLLTPDIPDNKKVLPIPQSEIDISNHLIEQNSGYR